MIGDRRTHTRSVLNPGPAPILDWDGDGRAELVAGADHGPIWYGKPEHFGSPDGVPDLLIGVGPRDDE